MHAHKWQWTERKVWTKCTKLHIWPTRAPVRRGRVLGPMRARRVKWHMCLILMCLTLILHITIERSYPWVIYSITVWTYLLGKKISDILIVIYSLLFNSDFQATSFPVWHWVVSTASAILIGTEDTNNSKYSQSTCSKLTCVKYFTYVNEMYLTLVNNPMRQVLLIPPLYGWKKTIT